MAVPSSLAAHANTRGHRPRVGTCLRNGVAGTAATGTIVTSPADKAALVRRVRRMPAAVDLESAAWARAAATFNVPIAILRIVVDAADEELPPFLAGHMRADGSVRRWGIAASALVRPARIPSLVRLARRTWSGSERLAGAVERMIGALAEPGVASRRAV